MRQGRKGMRKVASARPPSEKSPSAGAKRYWEMPEGYAPGCRDWEPGHVIGPDGNVWHECIVSEPPASSGEDSNFDKYQEWGYEVAREMSPTKRIYRIPIDQFIARRKADENLAAERRRAPIVTAEGAKETRKQLRLSEAELLERVESAQAASDMEDN